MSSRFAPEQLASVHRDAAIGRITGGTSNHAPRLPAVDDMGGASRSPARLLITASTQHLVETLARRVHGNGPRAQFPFVVTAAGALPVGAHALRKDCVRFLDAAAGGSVLLGGVEEMPAAVQEAFIDLLAGLASARKPSAAVRLISGTTVSLLDRVAAGTFSERLFYQLNTIHLMVGTGTPAAAHT